MPDSLTDYTALELLEWAFAGTDFDVSPGSLYLTVLDGTGTDLAGDLSAARAEATTADWSITNTEAENVNELSLGDAQVDITGITYAALFDAATGGNEVFRTAISGGPYDASTGTEVTFEPGDLTFDAITFDE
jgi:hypothetical protein